MNQAVHDPCVICGGPVLRGSDSRAKWLKRPTCGNVCGKKYRLRGAHERMAQAIKDHAPCANPDCRVVVLPREGERVSDYSSRRGCSMRCGKLVQWAKRRSHQKTQPTHASLSNVLARPLVPIADPAGEIDLWLTEHKATVCPPRFAAPTLQSALSEEEERRRIAAIKPPPEKTTRWGNDMLFGRGRSTSPTKGASR